MSIADQVIDATRSPDFLATEMPAGIRVPRCSSPDPCAARQNMIDNGDMAEEYWLVVLSCLSSPVPPPIGYGGRLATWTRFLPRRPWRSIFEPSTYARYVTIARSQ